MKINRLFTFDVTLIKDLNDEIPKGNRSKFVNTAVSEKLYQNANTVRESTGKELLLAAMHREDTSEFVIKVIKREYGIHE